MNASSSRAGIRSIATLLVYFMLGIFFTVSSYSQQSNCEYASDYDIEVTMGVTTLQVHGDQCYSEGDKLIVTCVDNNNVPSRDTFNYVSCNAAPVRSGSQRTLTLSEFTANVDLSGCSAVEVLYPDGSVGYYEILADETPDPGTDFSGFLNLSYCEDECLIFSVVDAWGALVGVVGGELCCVNGELIQTPDCGVCEQIFEGQCNPEPGECQPSYGAVDFGCVEIGRSAERAFYVNSCPFVKDQRATVERNGISELNTGVIECFYPDIDNLFDNRLALAEDHCEIIIYDIKIQAEHLDDMVVRDGPNELPFSLVGDFEFPIALKRGDNLPFHIEFAPESYDYFEALVTICYENDCECDRLDPRREQDNSRDGMHCETSKWYDFTVLGAGKDSEEILGNGECRLKCPECIYTPEAIQTNGFDGGGPCGGYFEYTIGNAGAGPPPMGDPSNRNGFNCGDLYLDTEENGQLYIYDAGGAIPDRLPEQQGWIPTEPAPYGLESFNLECNQGARFSLPYVPYLFFDEDDAELYLVPGYGQPVEQVDIIVSLESDNNVTRDGIGYTNCGDYEPGDIFYIFPDELELRQNPLGEPIAYEFIACDGYRLFAKLVDEMAEPLLSCSFYAEFPGTFSMGYYEPYSNGSPFKEGCYAWLLDDCDPIPDLLSSNTDENLDGELEIVDPCSCGDPDNVYGGPNGAISLFHDFISVGGPNIDNTFDIEVEITQGELYDENNVVLPRLGENNRIQLNWDPGLGVHFLEFWTEPGIGFGGQIYVNGVPSSDPDATLLSICDGPCAPIPTLGEWGITILSILLLIIGLIGLRQPKLRLQRIKR